MLSGFRATALFCLVALICGVFVASVSAQTTISTGSIQGTVLDAQGAVVDGAKVAITSRSTGQVTHTLTTSSGTYASGALIPGNYTVRVEAAGFKTAELQLTVQVGVTTPGNVKLQVGETTQVVEVQASALRVNTEQATVQGVVTAEQIDSLPINGRNFLDLAQLEPGVQIQDGGTFDPTKNGFSSISFGGRYGRTARIEVDGIDISDETVGTTTQNIPQGAIQEFQLSQSSLDLSTELTSSGAVSVVTRSGSNNWHGNAFYAFRDARMAAHLPGEDKSQFQRHQYGARFGGPIIKDKMFFFLTGERTKQDLQAPVVPGSSFSSLSGNFNSPFRESQLMGKLDYQLQGSAHLFYRFSFDQNRNVSGYLPNTFQPFANNNHTPVHVVGFDFNTGVYTHSVRFGYTKFRNRVSDAVAGSSIFNPAPGIELAIGNDPFCLTGGANDFCSGPNFLAPQSTFQRNIQIKYDGSRTWGSHIIRYGGGYNRITGGGTAQFLASGPAVNSVSDPALAANVFPGGAGNPLNYPADTVVLGNGQGFSSEFPAFGLPGGRLGPDNRLAWYAGDTWKFRRGLTITAGVRYVRDTGRTDSDLAPPPCSQLDPGIAATFAANGVKCSDNIIDLWGQGLGARVHQPNTNFAPQVGIAWDPKNSGKTVIRAGAGLFYENSIWNNNLYNRPPRLQQGLFLSFQNACIGGTAQTFTLPGTSTDITPGFCNQPIGQVADQIIALQQQFIAATAAAGAAVNAAFIGNTLGAGQGFNSTNLFAPGYKSPRSIQWNIGIQREIRNGTVLTVDYVRNKATRTLLAVDVNHVGDAQFLDVQAALDAINTTIAGTGCGPAATAGASSQAAVACWMALPQNAGKTIDEFAQNGLDSANAFCFGSPCFLAGQPNAAFPGKNKFLGTNQMLFPVGKSTYEALQMSLKQNWKKPFRGVSGMNFQFSYSYSSYKATATDGDFINSAEDNNRPTGFLGPNGLDRKHQVSFGGTMDLPARFRLSMIGHFYSPLPLSLRLPGPSTGRGGIFTSDVTGDGTGEGSFVANASGDGDLLPGTKLGAYGRSISASDINKIITKYNQTFAGQLTPAGAALVNANIFSVSQLVNLQAVMPALQQAPQGQAGLSWLRSFDLSLGWNWKVGERFVFEPNVSFFNVFNFANFDGPNNTLSGILDGSVGSANGTNTADHRNGNTRIGLGSGLFALGSPRAMEFGLKMTF